MWWLIANRKYDKALSLYDTISEEDREKYKYIPPGRGFILRAKERAECAERYDPECTPLFNNHAGDGDGQDLDPSRAEP